MLPRFVVLLECSRPGLLAAARSSGGEPERAADLNPRRRSYGVKSARTQSRVRIPLVHIGGGLLSGVTFPAGT